MLTEFNLMNCISAPFAGLSLSQPHNVSPFYFTSFSPGHRLLFHSKCNKRLLRRLMVTCRSRTRYSCERNGSSERSGVGGKPLAETSTSSTSFIQQFHKPIACVLFCIALNFTPIRRIQAPAIAAPVATELKLNERVDGHLSDSKEHGSSSSTRRLLETVSAVLRCMEDIKRGNGSVEGLEAAMKAVKVKSAELQDEIMGVLYEDLRALRKEKEGLVKRSEEILDEALKLERGYKKLAVKGDKVKVAKVEEKLGKLDEEYSDIWESVGEVDDMISRKETFALSIRVREIRFIEGECEALVEKFKVELQGRSAIDSAPASSISRLSKEDIQKDLKNAQRNYMEQMLLPRVMEIEAFGPLSDQELVDFAHQIGQGLKESRKLQRNLEAHIRRKMKKFGDEKRFLVNVPCDEVVKGFPDVELKWMFGNKEVVVPKAISLHLYQGWKRWREEAKADLKRNLLEDVDFGKRYVAQRQEQILLDRDRVVSKTWYNEEKSRWEIDPIAVPYAVSKKLVDSARIRHDWGAMYFTLKGEANEYFLDIREFEMAFEDFGGFDGLYMKLLACGVPTVVQLMWIPLSELNFQQQFLLAMRLSRQCLIGLWNTKVALYARNWVVQKVRNINDDIAMVIFFPIVEFLIPYPVRMQLGMAWPEEIGQTVGSTWYLKWQSEAEMNFKSRKTDGIEWFFWFIIRSAIYGFVLFHVFHFLKRKVPRFLGYGPLRKNPNRQKLRRVKEYLKFKVRKIRRKKKAGIDPIRSAFDGMKRVKSPPIPLKDFASIDSMIEEINEVVAFLRNPRAFQEMGARAPRGVLIVGERGTGKTSLAMAIAAEARVPVVKVEAQQLEPGLWVGQSASNVRELFQTARDLAPVIIFVEDFDLFAGVRGKFIHTKKQDHEAFINQLLVELDGFEKQDGVVLMATTSSLKQIDEALQRPGRMDRVFHLQRPTQAEREKILHIAAKETMDNDLIDFVDWRKVAEKTSLLRPIELKLVPVALEGSAFRSKFVDADELMSYCSWLATFSHMVPKWIRRTNFAKKVSRMLVDHLGLTLTREDLQNVVDLMEPYGQISNGMELLNPPLDWTRETKFPHAVWAAGRALIALLLPNFDAVDNLWLEPSSWQGIGCTKITKAKSEGSVNANTESRSYLEKKLVFCFGSHIAAQLLLPFGEENFLSSSELMQAQEIATRMVIQYGWGPDDSPATYYRSGAATALSMGDNHEYEIAAKVEKMYDLAYCKANQMLQKNRRALEKIVEELLEFEILTGKDLERIWEANGGIREKEPFSLVKLSEKQPILSSSFLDGGNASGTALLGAPS
ncbi:hypothetical protein SAY86_025206 [Trapa natans]|uniref:AAA+ ATPase domain-containing protein n=1 Tax=Trapa natans TaxID=22666 RepID=A0AAN7M7P3_TRANT|nr:hypothetical protein SAY86_025206 [Trapa natans]